MKKISLALLALFALTACEPTDDEKAKMRVLLPHGCAIEDLGSYGFVRHVVVVFCNGRQTRTESYEENRGKTSDNIGSVQID